MNAALRKRSCRTYSSKCERLSVEEVFTRNRRPVKDGDQLYLGR